MTKRSIRTIFVFILGALIFGLWFTNRIAKGDGPPFVPEGYETVSANGYDFSCQIAGNPDSAAIILLHGFPETASMWNRLITDLDEMGYYVIAPDQRGYSAGARPKQKELYQLSNLAEDVVGIADALDIEQFHLVGHDWGAGVGWQVAADYEDRVLTYTSLSVPHITAFGKAYKEDKSQFDASFYIRRFQLPVIPEFYLARNDYGALRQAWSEHTDEELANNLNVFRQKGALTGAINWYRANYDFFDEDEEVGDIEIPVLFIWGNNDIALKRSGVEWTKDYVSGYYRFVEMDAGHWLVQEKYEEVKEEISNHISLIK